MRLCSAGVRVGVRVCGRARSFLDSKSDVLDFINGYSNSTVESVVSMNIVSSASVFCKS